MSETTPVETAIASVTRLANYDVYSIPRREDLGAALAFDDAVEPTKRVLSIFKRIPLKNLDELPVNELNLIAQQADAFYNILDRIESYDSDELTSSTRDAEVEKIRAQFQPIFSKLYPLISYLTIRTTNFGEIETEARAAMQASKDEATTATSEVTKLRDEAIGIMDSIRKTAAEQGVSQQAIYFSQEGDKHRDLAKDWRKWTVVVGCVVLTAAILALGLHELPFLNPDTTYEAVQLSLSKFILFGVLGYALVFCARNYMSHKHNEIVNRHKQNSLVTFSALRDAASVDDAQNIILERASNAIFEVPESGFTKQLAHSPSLGSSILRISPKVGGSDPVT